MTLRGAVIDGYLLTESPEAVFPAGKQIDVPAISGNARDEMMSSLARVKSVAEFREAVTRMAGPKAEQLFKLHPVSQDENVPAVALKMSNAGDFARQMVNRARLHLATGKTPVCMSVSAKGKAGHGADLLSWFAVLDLPGAVADPGRKIEDTDRAGGQDERHDRRVRQGQRPEHAGGEVAPVHAGPALASTVTGSSVRSSPYWRRCTPC